MITRKKFLAIAAALYAGAMTSSAIASPYGVKVGVLDCTVEGGWGYVLGSSKDVRCAYHPNHGADDHYVGSISKFGVDLGYTSGGTMVWDVIAPTSDMRNGALQGDYAGATASATVAAGVGANVLIGGFDKSIALQPISFDVSSGLDIAAGVGELSLKAAPAPVATTAPARPVVLTKERLSESYAVSFGFDKAVLTPAGTVMVRDAAAEAIRNHPQRIVVVGHADRVGTASYNDTLSLRRALAVRAELIRYGVEPSAINVAGRGFHDSSVPTAPGIREPQNRCVVIELKNDAEQRQAAL